MRSKPDQVDQPERMLIMIVQCSLQLICYTTYYSIETVLLIFPFLQTNITVQIRPSEGYGVVCRLPRYHGTTPSVDPQSTQTSDLGKRLKRTSIRLMKADLWVEL